MGAVPWPTAYRHRTFLATTILTYEDDFGFYCHAGIAPGIAPQMADEEIYLVRSGYFLTAPLQYPKPIVFGHYELTDLLVTPQRICLNIAAYRTGVLKAMRMETGEIVQISR